ncbi:hypothetical protein GALMADRAFT_252281 [Galerina marginata CBS 339.88]|uniref:F-box domain-containing protein n=1 Tax=Galerina marginata (strain CBS 339.88) TaxID=685588 RepID=A0A067SPT9_GALM3|nr:hypothetical protein GALMADRAFT_252281 [Galerina marginata CBS 339.88]
MTPQPSIPVHSIGDSDYALPDRCPIASLPEELWTLILDIVVDSFDHPSGSVARAKAPLIASQVSRSWRLSALENCHWWSTIAISGPWRMDAIEAYLERSKECLLEIVFIYNPYAAVKPTSEDYQRLLGFLFPHFPRCRVLHITKVFDYYSTIPFSFLKDILNTYMPYLEEFTLEVDPLFYRQDLSQSGVRSLFSSAPHLRDLRLIGIAPKPPLVPLDARTPNSVPLTSLHLSPLSHRLTFQEFKMMLRACPSLTTLALYNHPTLSGSPTPCNMPSLESLYIIGGLSQLTLHLVAPKLKELIIAPISAHDLDTLVFESYRNFGAPNPHRFPALRVLTLGAIGSKAYQAVRDASTCFPQVECLVLPTLRDLSLPKVFADNCVVFPNLLDLALTGIDERNYTEIQELQVFRAQQRRPLRTVYVDSASLTFIKSEVLEGDLVSSDVVEGNLWEAQRRGLLRSEVQWQLNKS